MTVIAHEGVSNLPKTISHSVYADIEGNTQYPTQNYVVKGNPEKVAEVAIRHAKQFEGTHRAYMRVWDVEHGYIRMQFVANDAVASDDPKMLPNINVEVEW